jgi:hypothetical protein
MVAAPRTWERIAIGWVVFQTSGIIAWWSMLLLLPSTRVWFLIPSSPELNLVAFLLPDAVLGVIAGVISVIALHRRHPLAWPALVILTGAMAYAALYCIAVAIAGGGWLGAVLMAPCLVVLPLLCWRLRP